MTSSELRGEDLGCISSADDTRMIKMALPLWVSDLSANHQLVTQALFEAPYTYLNKSPQQSYEVAALIVPFIDWERPGEGKCLAQGHIVGEWWSRDVNPGVPSLQCMPCLRREATFRLVLGGKGAESYERKWKVVREGQLGNEYGDEHSSPSLWGPGQTTVTSFRKWETVIIPIREQN